MTKMAFAIVWCAVSLVCLPMAGVLLRGLPVADYLEFPPLTRYVQHAAFSWVAFTLMATGILAVVLPFDIWVLRHRGAATRPRNKGPLPPWGWLGLLVMLIGWCLAWTRFRWYATFQPYTFTIPWIGYIVLVNAQTYRRSGCSMMTHYPRYLVTLFVLSAGFWWFFEYLNRFVQNWYYVGIDGLGRLEYFILATLPFSTVLPAVLSTRDLLRTFPEVGAGLDGFLRVRIPSPGVLASAVFVASSIGLCGISIWPDYLFPLLWLAPLFLITSAMALAGKATLFAPISEGKWRELYLLGMAGLVCGLFWEMWNFYSLARWEYAVPFVGRFKLFEMPMLGYAGYLPFGLECAVAGQLVDSFLKCLGVDISADVPRVTAKDM
jgi:hypothetical protein